MIFDSVSFKAQDYVGSQVEDNVLYIYTKSRTFDVQYSTAQFAYDAQFRLENLIESNKEDNPSSLLKGLQSKIQKQVDSITNKVKGTDSLLFQMAADAVLETVKAKAEKLHDDLEEALGTVTAHVSEKIGSMNIDEIVAEVFNVVEVPDDADNESKPVQKEQPVQKPSGKRFAFDDAFSGDKEEIKASPTADEVKSKFGTPEEPLIEDLSYEVLVTLVNSFVDDSVSNPSVQGIFSQLTDTVGEEQTNEAVKALKNMLVEMALSNTKITFSALINKFFM